MATTPAKTATSIGFSSNVSGSGLSPKPTSTRRRGVKCDFERCVFFSQDHLLHVLLRKRDVGDVCTGENNSKMAGTKRDVADVCTGENNSKMAARRAITCKWQLQRRKMRRLYDFPQNRLPRTFPETHFNAPSRGKMRF